MWRIQIASFFASLCIRILIRTWRVRVHESTKRHGNSKVVYCFWHGRQAGLFAFPRNKSCAVLSSHSKDGELQASILKRLGFTVARGSSSHGGAAGLKSMVRRVRGGEDAAFAVDGPRGPAHKVKPGAILTAMAADALLVPIAVRATRSITFRKAWDQYELPLPFSTVDIHPGPPISTRCRNLDSLRLDLSEALSALDNAHASA